jgi:hypothetical protein
VTRARMGQVREIRVGQLVWLPDGYRRIGLISRIDDNGRTLSARTFIPQSQPGFTGPDLGRFSCQRTYDVRCVQPAPPHWAETRAARETLRPANELPDDVEEASAVPPPAPGEKCPGSFAPSAVRLATRKYLCFGRTCRKVIRKGGYYVWSTGAYRRSAKRDVRLCIGCAVEELA